MFNGASVSNFEFLQNRNLEEQRMGTIEEGEIIFNYLEQPLFHFSESFVNVFPSSALYTECTPTLRSNLFLELALRFIVEIRS